MSSLCPFAKAAQAGGVCPMKSGGNHDKHQPENEGKDNSVGVTPKCPFGYDSNTFKLGPLSCLICQALLYESNKCVPCSHKFCK